MDNCNGGPCSEKENRTAFTLSQVNELPDGCKDQNTRNKLLIIHPAHLSKQPKRERKTVKQTAVELWGPR